MPSVLLVDDNATVRDVLRLHAESRGLDVVAEAVDGGEAIELAERLGPDAIILEQELSTMPGLAALRVLRRRAPGAVVVMYCTDPSLAGSALAAGAHAYVAKADSPGEVVETVLSLLEEAALRAAEP